MPQTVKGVISRSKGADVEVVDIVVPDPGPGEAVVKIETCGVCHTDLHYREGGINDDYPFLLGHEAAGYVEAVGEGVTDVAPGDFVILNWRAVCGQCRACAKGKPWYCFNTHNATQKMTLTDGTELTPALGIGAFIEKTLVAAGQCTKVPEADAAAVGLLGCGVMAGFGAAVNTGGVSRGDSIAVIGCGGVGNAAIAGAKVAGATTIIAVDVSDAKLEQAKHFGATHTVNSKNTDAVEAIRGLTGGNGADVVVEAVGPTGDVRAGVLRPRPRRHRRPRRRPHARPAGDAADDRHLRPRRRAQVELVRRLPPEPRLPDARRALQAGPLRPRRLRQRADRPRRHRGGVREDARRRGAAIGGRAVSADAAADQVTPSPGGVRIDHTTTEGTFSLDGGTWEVENNVWVIGDDTRVRRHRRPARRRARSSSSSVTAA